MTEPSCILADEPTGNLDTEAGNLVTQILSGISCKEKRTVVIVSHDERIKDVVDHILYVRDGEIVKEEKGGHNKEDGGDHNHHLTY